MIHLGAWIVTLYYPVKNIELELNQNVDQHVDLV